MKEKVKLQPFLNLADAITYAESVEEIIKLNLKKNTRKGPWNTSSKSAATKSSMTHYNKDQKKDKTNETNGKKQAENAYQRLNLSKCFRCGQTSHLSNACPKRKTVAILEEDEDYVEEQEEDFSQEEEVLEPDDRERLSYVLQRVLITPKSDTSHQQRHSLFKTRCTIQAKCAM